MICLRTIVAGRLLLAICLVSACSSVHDLEMKPASVEFDSAKTPTQLAACITEKWSEHNPPIETQLRTHGFVVSIRNEATGGGVVSSAVITELGEGSHLRYAELDISVGFGWMAPSVMACK